MTTKNIRIAMLAILFLFAANIAAQETVTVPLSNPTKSGILQIEIISGSIIVKGTKEKDVIIKRTRRKDDTQNGNINKNRKGLKKVLNNSLEFSVKEFDNVVKVQSSSSVIIDFEILVPENFSLKISTINKGEIYVENVNGTMDISNTNGEIRLKDISGSVSADALNKDITINFIKVTPNVAMAFSSLNGDIDVTFPKAIKADIKIKSDRGEIYTDFNLKEKQSKEEQSKVKMRNGQNKNTYNVEFKKQWVIGSINGGGAKILFKNYNGDVIIREK